MIARASAKLSVIRQVEARHKNPVLHVWGVADVAGVIVGCRQGVSEHVADNARVFTFELVAEDRSHIEAVTGMERDLFNLLGDCGAEYRS